jgi:type II secretory pathway predicted ATPase ExeA
MQEQQNHLAFFRLAEEPFAPMADPACFYATAGHQSCLRQIWRVIEARHGAALVLGESGAGKTMILRKLAASLKGSGAEFRCAVISAPLISWTTLDLLAQILTQFGITPGGDTTADYTEALIADLVRHRQRNNTLLIDDAQNLNKRGQLELLRILLNLELPQHKLLNMVLFAQPDWSQVLEAAPSFAQRIVSVCRLRPLEIDNIRALVQFRLGRAGVEPGRGPQFQEDAYRELEDAAGGMPRTIVNLCRNALELAAEQRTWLIDSVIIQEAAQRSWLGMRKREADPTQDIVPQRSPAEAQVSINDRPPAPQSRPAPTETAPARAVITSRATADDEVQPSREDRARQLLLRARARKET